MQQQQNAITMKAAERDLLSFSELKPEQIKVKKVYVDQDENFITTFILGDE